MFLRTVIKLSGEALAGGSGKHFDDHVVDSIVNQIKKTVADGTQVALIVGGGNFWRGRLSSPDLDRVKSDQIGMLATVMNGIYVAEAFRRHQVDARVMTPVPFGNMTTLYDKDHALKLMADGTVIINAAGLGHPFFSTDTITALRAAELDADCVLYAKSVDGVYDKDPKRHPDARKYKNLTYRTAIASQLNAADLAALHLSQEAGIPSFVFGLDEPESICRACRFPETGSLEGTLMDVELEEEFYVNTSETV